MNKKSVHSESSAKKYVNGIRPFGLRDKIGYAFGDFGCNLSFALLSAYLMDFYTQFIGLSSAAWSIIIILTKVWDAVNDPIMGGIMDSRRIKSKGKFKPWIKIGSYGLVIAGALVFMPIPHAPTAVKIAVCIVTYLCWDLFYTIVNVPYGALNSAISADPLERTSLSTWRSIGAGAGALFTMLLPLLVYDKNDTLIGVRLIWIGMALGVLAFVCYSLCIKLTTERYEVETAEQKFSYIETIKGIFKNRPLLAMCLASFALLVFFTSNTQTTKWLFQFYFGNAKTALTLASIIIYIPMVVFIPLVGKIVRRFGKKRAAGVPLLISIVACVVLLLIPMQEGSAQSAAIYVAGLLVIQSGGGIFQLICWAIITDCIDYQQLITGKREEGSVYAVYSLFRKLAQGVALSLVLLSMNWVGYDAQAAVQASGVPERMKNMAIILMLIGAVIMSFAMLIIYNLDDKKVPKGDTAK